MPKSIYRPQAMQAMESHEDIERLLPVTSWRLWLAAVASALLVIAALVFAAADSRAVTVSGDGRVTDGYGVRLVSATVAGQIASFAVEGGDTVVEDQIVAYVRSGDDLIAQRTANAGRVIGTLWRPGDPVEVGSWLVEVAATETDGRQVLVALPVSEGQKVAKGQPAQLQVTGTLGLTPDHLIAGEVIGRTEALRAKEVEIGLALLEPPTEKKIVVAIRTDEPLEPGSEVRATITVSQRNLLAQLFGQS